MLSSTWQKVYDKEFLTTQQNDVLRFNLLVKIRRRSSVFNMDKSTLYMKSMLEIDY